MVVHGLLLEGRSRQRLWAPEGLPPRTYLLAVIEVDMHDPKTKSAFAPMRPRIDTELADRLIRQAEERRSAAKAALPEVVSLAAKATHPESEKKAVNPRVAPVHSEPITVSLVVEIVDDLQRVSPAWGFVKPFTLGTALKRAYEPTKAAVAARDWAALASDAGHLDPNARATLSRTQDANDRPAPVETGCKAARHRLGRHERGVPPLASPRERRDRERRLGCEWSSTFRIVRGYSREVNGC
jgi:hypothetical protein